MQTIRKTRLIEDHGRGRIIDADYSDTYGIVYLCEVDQLSTVYFNGIRLVLDDPGYYTYVRFIDQSTLVLANMRAENFEENIVVIDKDGGTLHRIHGGDAIGSILSTPLKHLWIGYGDEGIFGEGISTEVLVQFSQDGTILFRYQTDLTRPPTVIDCEIMALGKQGIWLFPFPTHSLIHIEHSFKKMKKYIAPRVLHNTMALCVRSETAYFQTEDETLYTWLIGSRNKARAIASLKGRMRGLADGESFYFIQLNDHAIYGISIEK